MLNKKTRQIRRKKAIRGKISGNIDAPRLNVFRSNNHIYGALVDDTEGKTLLAVTDKNLKGVAGKTKVEQAFAVGKALAEKALEKKIKKVSFDRGGYLYHGRVRALAEGAREGGLDF